MLCVGVLEKRPRRTPPRLTSPCPPSPQVSHWIVRCVLECAELSERVELVAIICEVLRELRELNNFNSIMNIMAALNNAAIHRLKHTFAVRRAGVTKGGDRGS